MTYHLGNGLGIQYRSMTYHIGNGIKLGILLLNLHEVLKRFNIFGTVPQVTINGSINISFRSAESFYPR